MLAFFGHHKCGTTWIRQVVDHLCGQVQLKVALHHEEACFGQDIVAYQSREPFDFWCYTNADIAYVRGVKVRGFHVVRDPRDLIVSGYFSHFYSHPERDWPALQQYRPYLRTLSKHDGLLAEMEFNSPFLRHMEIWDYSNPEILELRFEDMIAADTESFTRVFEFLGLFPHPLTLAQICAATDEYSFVNLARGRVRGQEDAHSHYRKGQPGDWRNHFEAAHVDQFKKLYNPLLLKLGYERDEDWNNVAPKHEPLTVETSPHAQGLQLFQAGEYEKAAQLFHQALLEAENAERWNDWATAQLFCGRIGQAETGYRRALDLEPSHPEARVNLHVILASGRPIPLEG